MKCPACKKRETFYRLVLEAQHAWKRWENLGSVEVCEECLPKVGIEPEMLEILKQTR